MNEFVLALITLVIGLVTGAVIGVAYLHRNFVSAKRYQDDQEREERQVRYIVERVDGMTDRLTQRLSGRHRAE